MVGQGPGQRKARGRHGGRRPGVQICRGVDAFQILDERENLVVEQDPVDEPALDPVSRLLDEPGPGLANTRDGARADAGAQIRHHQGVQSAGEIDGRLFLGESVLAAGAGGAKVVAQPIHDLRLQRQAVGPHDMGDPVGVAR